MTADIMIFTIGPTCVQCNQTKRILDGQNIPYIEFDLRNHPALADLFKTAGHLTAPVVIAHDQIWSGFRLEKLKDLIRRERGHHHD